MISSKYSIAMAAVLFAAAFAGVAIIADDASAADSDVGEYTITYSYDGLSIQKRTEGGQLKVDSFNTIFGDGKAPAGYAFDYWVAGSAIYKVDKEDTKTQFAGDTVLTPVFKAAQPIVKLIYGDKVLEIPLEPTEIGTAPTRADIGKDFTATVDDISTGKLKDFADLIGATIVTEVKTISASGPASGPSPAVTKTVITGFTLPGFEFKGFVKADGSDVAINALSSKGTYDAVGVSTGNSNSTFKWVCKSGEVTTYTAVFEPVYTITFIVEGAQVGKAQSNAVAEGKVAESGLPVAPVKENYIFIGWFDAEGNKVIGYSVDKDEYAFTAGKDFKFTADTTLYAHFVPLTYTVTFVYGEDKAVFTTETVKYGEKAIEPKGLPEGYKGWDFDFANAILADTEIVAIPADPVTIYTVTFEIDGKAPVTQRSDSMVLPDTAIDGKVFQGWVVKGESQYVDPMKYDIKSDITFVAVYKTADPPAGPSFFETNTGKCVAVIIGVGIIALFYAVYTNMFGMKDFLTSFKVQRVKKE